MTNQLYHISDELQFSIDWERIYKMPRWAGGHDEQMKGLFKDAKVIAHWNQGDYQGMVATCVQIPDGRFVIYNDYYGSCSGCDAWEDATNEEVKNMCINLANGAYIFESLTDVFTFLSQEEFEAYEWNNCAKPLLKRVMVYCFACSLVRLGFADKGDLCYTFDQHPFMYELKFNNKDAETMFVNLYIDGVSKPLLTQDCQLPLIPVQIRDSYTITFISCTIITLLSRAFDTYKEELIDMMKNNSISAIRKAMNNER